MPCTPHLSFDGHCRTAFTWYQQVLGGRIRTMLRFADSPMAGQVPDPWRDRILHASLDLDDGELLGGDAFPDGYRRPQGFQVTLGLDGVERGRRVFADLSTGGTVHLPFQATFWSPGFGTLVDRFGIPWEVNCRRAGPSA